MPAFPIGRTAPAFPRVGPAPSRGENVLDPVTSPELVRAVDGPIARPERRRRRELARLLLKRLVAARRPHRRQRRSRRADLRDSAERRRRRARRRERARRAAPAASARSARHSPPGPPRRRSAGRGALPRVPLRRTTAAAARGDPGTSTAGSTPPPTCAASSPASTPALPDDGRASPTRTSSRAQAEARRPQRPRRHADPGDGHRHRRPVDGHARLAAAQRRVLPPARRPGRSAHRQRAEPRLRVRPR